MTSLCFEMRREVRVSRAGFFQARVPVSRVRHGHQSTREGDNTKRDVYRGISITQRCNFSHHGV